MELRLSLRSVVVVGEHDHTRSLRSARISVRPVSLTARIPAPVPNVPFGEVLWSRSRGMMSSGPGVADGSKCGAVGADAEEVQHRSGPRDRHGIGDHDSGRVNPFVFGGDEDG
ncbi:hypothetical protein RHA1_ro08005 (plasmid) [Rhodococcus jostii RHA1]|uniref:Uncharacterized protein n=1 Tax=Rhodococcus jostii (strain RHA1) TaxID=101510 RepID=Q0S084_RHOJR|nr:hypothetical protein RHA1_ro08005 [Rhodococcus jostii RHA1]